MKMRYQQLYDVWGCKLLLVVVSIVVVVCHRPQAAKASPTAVSRKNMVS